MNQGKCEGKEILSTHGKKVAAIKRETVGLLTPSPAPTPVADRRVTMAVIPQLYNFTLCGEVKGYATEQSDSDLDSITRRVTQIVAAGGVSGTTG